MTTTISPYQLGATLYVPATRSDLADIVLRQKIPDLRSLVICLEDSIKAHEIPLALGNVQQLLAALASDTISERPLLFIRPRHIGMAHELLSLKGIKQINGLVLPKFDNGSFQAWQQLIEHAPQHWVFMPTLETAAILDVIAVRELCQALKASFFKQRILVLRIGGNDLLSCLKLRHSHTHTLYDGPLNYVVGMLVAHFVPADFYLTAPVFDCFRNVELLKAEFQRDLLNGLVGKTVIHPMQISIIHSALKVDRHDYEAAKRILDPKEPAVFEFEGAMCEPSTHQRWAWQTLERAKYFGYLTA
ncbi:MAG: HpcH/HpaI aldolase/citrate lyase family protein [Thiolinea sp.]